MELRKTVFAQDAAKDTSTQLSVRLIVCSYCGGATDKKQRTGNEQNLGPLTATVLLNLFMNLSKTE